MNTEENDHQDLEFDKRLSLENLETAVHKIRQELAKVIVGQEEFMDLLIIALLSEGHVLIEGVPGVAKTITAKLFATCLQTGFGRIQFTPDLMPSDVIGTSVLNQKTSEFEFKAGPIFSNLVLIDEINRAPAKTQAALFEVMQERQITVDGQKHELQAPFMVLATQNPIEQEGTYALPEAQLDRFLFKIIVDYPQLEEEIKILEKHHNRMGRPAEAQVQPVLSPEELKLFCAQIHEVRIESRLLKYIAEIISTTRQHPHLYLGASPRASIAVMRTAKAVAAIKGRDFVIPEDIQKVLKPVLRHRIILTPDREMEGGSPEAVIESIVRSVEIPR